MNAKDILARYMQAYNARDVATMLTLFSENCVFENVSGGKVTARAEGKAELGALAKESARAFASRKQQVRSITEDHDRLAVEVDFHGVLEADLSPELKAGTRLALRGISILEFADGKIIRLTDYS